MGHRFLVNQTDLENHAYNFTFRYLPVNLIGESTLTGSTVVLWASVKRLWHCLVHQHQHHQALPVQL